MKFKAFIRVVKSLNRDNDNDGFIDVSFGSVNIIEERNIDAENKAEVKDFIKKKYPQFFQNQRVYERESKDTAQFFYVVIFPLYKWEINQINEGEWICSQCGHKHENKYISTPIINDRIFPNDLFCKSDDNACLNAFKKEYYKDIELPDDENYIKKFTPTYIYKITEKSTNKCYIGKTRNEPFFRWWNHYKHSSSPFGVYLRKTRITDWKFEVIEILPPEIQDDQVFRLESAFIKKYNSIENGFNKLISNKKRELYT